MVEDEVYVMLMMMRADKTPNEKCSPEEMVACVREDDIAACLAACTGNENPEEPEQGNGSIKVTRVGSATTAEVAANAVAINAGSVKLTAGENDTKVSSLTFKHSGLGEASDVYLRLFINGEAASKSYVQMKNTADGVTVKLKPAITIKAGKSETIDVKAYLDPNLTTLNSVHTIILSDVTVNGTTSGTPIELNTLKTTSYGVEDIDTDIDTPASAITAGTTNALLATVTITPNADAKIQGFRVANDGTTDLDEAIANVKVYYQNEEVGTAKVTKDEIIVSNLNISAEAADDVVFKLKGDAIYMGQIASDIELFLDLFAVTAIESHSNQMMPSNDCLSDTLTINGVDVTVTKTTTGKQTVGGGENGVVMYGAKVEANADFTVTNYTVTLTRSAGAATLNSATLPTFKKLTLTVDGETTLLLDVTPANSGATSITWTLDDEFDISANKASNVKITANIYDEDNTNFKAGEFYFTFSINNIENSEGDAMPPLTGVERKGDTTKVEAAGYTIGDATEAAPANDKLYANADNFELGRWNIDAGTAELTISKITLTNVHTNPVTDLNETISSAVLWNIDDDKEITNSCKISAAPATTIVCDNIKNFVVAADSDVNVALLVDGASFDLADFTAGTDDGLQFNLEVSDGVLGTIGTFPVDDYDCTNEYVLGIIAPEITIVPSTTDPAVFVVTIANNDANDIVVGNLYVAMKKLKGDDSNYDSLRYGLRAVGSTAAIAGTTGAIDGTSYPLSYTRGTIKAGKSASAELVIDGNIADPVVQATITQLNTTTPNQENYYNKKADNKPSNN